MYWTFLTCYCIVLFLVFVRTEVSNGLLPKPRSTASLPHGKGHCQLTGCDISCFNGEASLLYFDINRAQIKMRCRSIGELLLHNYTFEDGTISRKWSPIEGKIKSIKIVSSNVQKLEPEAFALYDLSQLFLENLQIKQLVNGTLRGLKRLKKLTIIQKNIPIAFVSREFLKPVEFTLTELHVNAKLTAPDNLTNSCALLNTLEKVDLSFNNFHILGSKAFSMLSLVEDLNLSNSYITYLSIGIFSTLSATLRNLDLSHNLIQTFSGFVFQTPISRVNLKLVGNPWQCSCGLQLLIKAVSVHDINKITCVSPEQFYGQALVSANVCIGRPDRLFKRSSTDGGLTTISSIMAGGNNEGKTTESMDPKIESPPKIPSYEEKGLMKLKCLVCEGMYCNNTKKGNFKSIRLRPRKVDFAISMITENTVSVSILSSMKSPYALIWFSKVTKEFFKMEINYKEYGLGCLRNVSKAIVVSDLSPNSTYTFCLINMEFTTTSPFSCMAYRAPINFSDHNIWVSKNVKTIFISLMLLVILCSIILGGCISFCIIKQKPTLLRGSKRVILPNKSSGDIMVLPKSGSLSKSEIKSTNDLPISYQRHLNLRRSSCDSTDSSYVSPNLYEIIPSVRNLDTNTTGKVDICSSAAYLHQMRTKRMSNDPLPSIPVETLPGLAISDRRNSVSSA